MSESKRDYRPADKALAGRVILLTGAGGGIGRALAVAGARYGATMVLLGRTVEKLEATYDAVQETGGPRPTILPFDLEKATVDEYHAIVAAIEKEFGRLDGLVHNAALLGRRTPLEQYDPMLWQQVMTVNVTAELILTQACLPLLKEAEDASIIFTSSGVGRQPRAYWGAYAISKAANEAMMQVLADELENHGKLRVNSINPGATRTEMRKEAFPAEDPKTLLTPEEIVGSYLYLLGPDSRGVSGRQLDAQ